MVKRKGRRRGAAPIMLLWSKQEQRRFCDAVERFSAAVNDLERILAPRRRKAAATAAADGAGSMAGGAPSNAS